MSADLVLAWHSGTFVDHKTHLKILIQRSEIAGKRLETIYPFLALVSIVVFAIGAFWLAGRHLEHPGLYYDELLFVNGALNRGVSDLFIVSRWHGVPILLMDYIGALKAWIYHPIFSVWDVNPWTVRIPSLLIGITGEIFLIYALRHLFDWKTALLGAPLLLLDPDVLMHSRLDWGPNALAYFFRGAVILCMSLWIRKQGIRFLWIALVSILLGCFDKLNFIWIGAAAVGALAVTYRSEIYAAWSARTLQYTTLFICVALGLGASVIRSILISGRVPHPVSIPWIDRLYQAGHLLILAIGGGGPLEFIMGDGMRLWIYLIPGYVACIIVGGAIYLIKKTDKQHKEINFLMIFILFFIAAFVATKMATGPHHAALIAGLPVMLLAALLSRELTVLGYWSIAVIGSVILLSLGMILANQRCLSEFQKPPENFNWDPSQHEVAEFVCKNPGWLYITCDWGIATHLICKAKKGCRIEETWPKFTSFQNAKEFLCKNGDKFYIAGHHDEFVEMKSTKSVMREMLALPSKFNSKKVFDGKTYFILQIKKDK